MSAGKVFWRTLRYALLFPKQLERVKNYRFTLFLFTQSHDTDRDSLLEQVRARAERNPDVNFRFLFITPQPAPILLLLLLLNWQHILSLAPPPPVDAEWICLHSFEKEVQSKPVDSMMHDFSDGNKILLELLIDTHLAVHRH
jgi:hypothetical protein